MLALEVDPVDPYLLTHFRKRAGLSLRELGVAAAVPFRKLGTLEAGLKEEELARVALALGVRPEALRPRGGRRG